MKNEPTNTLDSIVWEELKSYSHNDDLRPADCASHAISIAKSYQAANIERIEALESALAEQNKIVQMASEILRAVPCLQKIQFPADWEPVPHPLLTKEPT